jgi:hypothetical protein
MIIIFITIFFIIVYLSFDYFGARRIPLKHGQVFGFACRRSKDLLIQEIDQFGNVWASRGMKIYLLKSGEDVFRKVAHVPSGFNFYWLRNFTFFRKLTLRPECIEFTVSDNGDISAFSSGRLWYLENGKSSFKEAIKMKNFGKGDQGLRNTGLLKSSSGKLFFGEYFRNKLRLPVKIFDSNNNGKTWEERYVFHSGEIRHLHAIQEDTYTKKLFFLSGDWDTESKIGFSDNEFKTVSILGEGSQTYRVCQLVFHRNSIYWGTDTSEKATSGIFKYDKKLKTIRKIGNVHGAVFFATRLDNGLIVMTTNRENNKLETDDYTRFYIINPETDQIKELIGGTWASKKPGFWFKYAQLRIQRYQGASFLAVSVMNQKEFSESEFFLIDSKEIYKWFNNIVQN